MAARAAIEPLGRLAKLALETADDRNDGVCYVAGSPEQNLPTGSLSKRTGVVRRLLRERITQKAAEDDPAWRGAPGGRKKGSRRVHSLSLTSVG